MMGSTSPRDLHWAFEYHIDYCLVCLLMSEDLKMQGLINCCLFNTKTPDATTCTIGPLDALQNAGLAIGTDRSFNLQVQLGWQGKGMGVQSRGITRI